MNLKKILYKHKKEAIIIGIALLFAVFFNFYKSTEVPACLNSDEVAFGYNTYALLETGKDEFGKTFPIRFQSFNDFKLPAYTYLSMPFVKLFGLTDFSTRLLNKVLAIALIPSMYIVALQLFKKRSIAALSTLLLSAVPWVYIISRHAHEGVTLIFALIWALYFTIRYQEDGKFKNIVYADIFLALSSHTYHLGRIFVVLFLLYQIVLLFIRWKSKKNIQLGKFIVVTAIMLFASLGIDALYGAPRVNSLFFFQNQGFQLELDEKLREDGNFILHNKATAAVSEITRRYFDQASPEFFVVSGDKNTRFGFNGIGLITPIEYLFVFIGLYYLYKKENRYRYLLTFLLVMSPVANALTWQDRSLIRTYFMILPIILTASYGLYYFVQNQKKHFKKAIIGVLFLGYLFFVVQSWDMYLNHYYKRAIVSRAWQCGYKGMAQYVSETYDTTDKYYITRKHGQPYIYLLFYNRVDPKVFQDSLVLTDADEYGFTQIRSFDKFTFEMPANKDEKGVTYIGYPDDFDESIPEEDFKKIQVGTEQMFWILER